MKINLVYIIIFLNKVFQLPKYLCFLRWQSTNIINHFIWISRKFRYTLLGTKIFVWGKYFHFAFYWIHWEQKNIWTICFLCLKAEICMQILNIKPSMCDLGNCVIYETNWGSEKDIFVLWPKLTIPWLALTPPSFTGMQ